jgi:hypothetical protein
MNSTFSLCSESTAAHFAHWPQRITAVAPAFLANTRYQATATILATVGLFVAIEL